MHKYLVCESAARNCCVGESYPEPLLRLFMIGAGGQQHTLKLSAPLSLEFGSLLPGQKVSRQSGWNASQCMCHHSEACRLCKQVERPDEARAHMPTSQVASGHTLHLAARTDNTYHSP